MPGLIPLGSPDAATCDDDTCELPGASATPAG
jgi:hypothetical protein